MADDTFQDGQTATNPKTGQKVIYHDGQWHAVPNTGGASIGGGQGGKPPTEGERKNAFLATRLAGALQQINEVSADGQKPGFASLFGGTGTFIGNALTSSDRQRVENAQLDLLDSALTLGTGAAYTKEQLQGYRQSYFPQLNDSDATVADKKRRLNLALQAAKIGAGGAAPQIDQALVAAGFVTPDTQAKGGDRSSGAAGAVADGSGAPPAGPTGGSFDPGSDMVRQDQAPNEVANAVTLTDAQRNAVATLAQNGGDAEAVKALLAGYGLTPDDGSLQQVVDTYKDPKNRNRPLAINVDNSVHAIDPGDGAQGALARGVANAGTLGFLDEAGALADTVGRGGTYADNLNRRRGYEEFDKENHGIARMGGQLFGSLPLGGVEFTGAKLAARQAGVAAMRSGLGREAAINAADQAYAARVAADSAIYGGAYGFGDTNGSLGDRVAGGAVSAGLGAATAGALTYGGAKVARSAAKAATPRASAIAYQEGQDLGIDLPLGATGNRAGAIVDQMLTNMPGSANLMAASGKGTRDQVQSAVANVASKYGSGNSLYSIGEAAQRGARSWLGKFDQTVKRVYSAIPIPDDAPTTTANSVQTLDGMLGRFSSNPDLAALFKNGELQGYRDALGNGSTSWKDLKDFRSIIGEKIGEARFSEGTSKTDLRALYGALSEDMKNSAAAQGPAALRKFNRANDVFASGQRRIEGAVTQLLGDSKDKPAEAAGALIDRLAQGNKGSADIKTLMEVRKTLPSAQWNDVAGSLISVMGQPANSPGREFSTDTFLRRFRDMAPDARDALFGNGAARDDLEKFVRVSEGLARAASVRNTSNTAGQVLTGLAFYSVGNLPALLSQAATSYGAAKLLTNPKFVRWATGYSKMMRAAVANGNAPASKAINSQLSYLTRIARAEPAIASDVLSLQARLADAFGTQPTRLAAQERRDERAPVQRQGRQQNSQYQEARP